MKINILKMLGVALVSLSGFAHASVLSGSAVTSQSDPAYQWGDGQHNLYQQWSIGVFAPGYDTAGSGWFYGSSFSVPFPWSATNADIYVAKGVTDPTQVSDASVFNYSSGALEATAGDTVFFRGSNGFFGAWVLNDFWGTSDDPTKPIWDWQYSLSFNWYFQDDGSANFSNTQVPEPGTWMLMLLAGFGLLVVRRNVSR